MFVYQVSKQWTCQPPHSLHSYTRPYIFPPTITPQSRSVIILCFSSVLLTMVPWAFNQIEIHVWANDNPWKWYITSGFIVFLNGVSLKSAENEFLQWCVYRHRPRRRVGHRLRSLWKYPIQASCRFGIVFVCLDWIHRIC